MSIRAGKTDKRKRSVKIIVAIYLGIFLVLILVWAFNFGRHALNLYQLSKKIPSEISQAEPASVIPLIDEGSHEVNAIYEQLRPLFPIFRVLRILPWIGPYLGQIEPLVTYSNGLSQAGEEIASGISPLFNETQADSSDPSIVERVVQVLQSGQDHFLAASQAINQAAQVRDQINPQILPTSIHPIYQKLDENFNLLVVGAQLLQVAPKLLGNGEAQSYLILAQNRDELRPTGGFISGIGLVTIYNGEIQEFTLGDSYAVDNFSKPYPAPPDALHRYLLADYWVTRDANWSPDFPTTARQAQSLYTLSTGIETQGVIAFNQLAVQRILDAIGPVHIPGIENPVTSANVEEYMRLAWAPGPQESEIGDWWQHRKDFMQQLGTIILDKALSSTDESELLGLAMTIVDLVNQGQVLMYINDTHAEKILEVGGWDGGVHPGKGDYLYLVDSNIGFNKVDAVINRSMQYQVDLSDIADPGGSVTITYQHSGKGNVPCVQVASYGNFTYQDMMQRCYWDYWRLYTPSGSRLESSTTKPVPADELLNGEGWSGEISTVSGEAGTQVFSGVLVLPLEQSALNQISYTLPPSILDSTTTGFYVYTLDVRSQPGLTGLPFQLSVILPPNAVVSTPGADWKLVSGKWEWQGSISHPEELSLTFTIKP